MRNAWSSRNTERTTRLISRALARSWPSGFSSTTRTVVAVQAGRAELGADRREEVRAGRQVHHQHVGRRLPADVPASQAFSSRVAVGLRQVEAQVVQQAGEARELLVGGSLGALDLLEALLQPGAVRVVAHRPGARRARIRPPSGSLPWRKAWNSAGMSLRQVEVAGAADDDEIECHEGTGYDASSSARGRQRAAAERSKEETADEMTQGMGRARGLGVCWPAARRRSRAR